MIENANCPKDQYMVIKVASYRGLPDTETCGLSDDYSCEVDVTCLVKKQCDGQHECRITVDNNLFSGDPCPGLKKYLYFEYQCADNAISFNESNVSSCPSGGLRVLTNISSNDIKAKEGDLVNLLCSAQGEPPITFSWTKDQKTLEGFMEKKEFHRSSLLVIKVRDETSFGKYICHIRDRFQATTHTIVVQKLEDTSSVQKLEETNFKEYLIVIIVMAILLIISLIFLVYFICQNRRQKPSNIVTNLDNHDKNHSTHSQNNSINIGDDDYENVELKDEQSTYTALKRSGDEETDDKLYTHLINEPQGYVNQEETAQDYVIQKKTEQDYVIQPETGM